MTDGSQQLLSTLSSLGCRTIYGIPGIHNLDIYDRLAHATEFAHVTARNEAGAAFMALGHGRTTGTPGVALVITGPGITNAATPMAQALHDSIPMLVISTQLSRRDVDKDRGDLHELRDSTVLAASLSKESRRVPDLERMDSYIRAAWDLACSGRPGPVHLEIPLDLLKPGAATAYEAEIQSATALLDSAQQIGIVVGGGSTAAPGEVKALAEVCNAPVVATAAGKGVLPDDHPLSLGGRLHMPPVREWLASCDVVLGVGTQLSSTDLWYEPFTVNGSYVAINLDPAHFDVARRADVAICGDCKAVLPELTTRLSERKSGPSSDAAARRVTELKGASDLVCSETYGLAPSALTRIRTMLTGIRASLPRDGVLVTDMTTAAYVGLSEYPTYTPAGYLHPVGYGTLGYALPAAIGAKAARPDTRVVALAGDGGFQFTSGEFAAACDARMGLPVIIYNDGGYGEIRRTEDSRHAGSRIAVDIHGPDFCAFARSYGAEGHQADDAETLTKLIREAFEKDYPTIIEVRAPRDTGIGSDA